MTEQCDSEIVNGVPCPGFHHKFDDCLAEALYGWTLDSADETTGTCDYQGHYALLIVPSDTTATVDEYAPVSPIVTVPAGNYIVHTASGGGVSLWTYDTPEEARAEFDAADARYALWSKGCELTGHDECAEDDECQLGGTPNY